MSLGFQEISMQSDHIKSDDRDYMNASERICLQADLCLDYPHKA